MLYVFFLSKHTNRFGKETMAVVLLLLLVFHLRLYTSILDAEYDHETALEGSNRFRFYWSVHRDQETVRFAVEVQTSGWIGVGFSTQSGKMKGSDVVIGWVKDGKGYLTVSFRFLIIISLF